MGQSVSGDPPNNDDENISSCSYWNMAVEMKPVERKQASRLPSHRAHAPTLDARPSFKMLAPCNFLS